MKILYILHRTQMDGSALSFFPLLDGTIKSGKQAIVTIPNSDSDFEKRLRDIGAQVFVVPTEFCIWPFFHGIKRILGYPYVLVRMFLRQIQSTKLLVKIINQYHPDIIHTNVSPLIIGHLAARYRHIPHVWHIREYCDIGLGLHLFPSNNLYYNLFRKDYSICITNDLRKYYHLDRFCDRKSVVIYDGIRSIDDFVNNPDKQHYFLSASRISEEKDIIKSIVVFSRFCSVRSDYKLVIIGDGDTDYVNECKLLASRLNIGDKVLFEGFQNDVNSYMQNATALLVASPFEGLGRMTIEALFNGCIVIGHNAGGTKEILTQTGGFLWNDENEFLDMMLEVSNLSKEKYSSMIIQAQNVVKSTFTYEGFVDSVQNFYSDICKSK